MKVCIVEDNDLVRKSLKMLCEYGDFESECFESSEDFLCKTENEANCFVFDYRLPGISGFELLQKIRQSGDETPAILISGNFNSPTFEDIKQLSNAVCLNKPFQPKEFLNLLERVSLSKPIA